MKWYTQHYKDSYITNLFYLDEKPKDNLNNHRPYYWLESTKEEIDKEKTYIKQNIIAFFSEQTTSKIDKDGIIYAMDGDKIFKD